MRGMRELVALLLILAVLGSVVLAPVTTPRLIRNRVAFGRAEDPPEGWIILFLECMTEKAEKGERVWNAVLERGWQGMFLITARK